MARSVNGYVTINVGVANGHKPVAASHIISEEERNRRARRLRKDGWSYRRIAAALDMSYASVCHLLDGDEARVPMPYVPALPPRRPAASPSSSPTASPPRSGSEGSAAALPSRTGSLPGSLEEMAAQIVILQQRLDTVLALNEGHRQSLARLERSMVATLQNEHRALGQRLHASVKALLERMLPTSLRGWTSSANDTAPEGKHHEQD